MADSQAYTVLGDSYYDDPSQLSQALRQRAGSSKSLLFTPSTDSHRSAIVPPVAFAIPRYWEQPADLQLQHPAVPPTDRAQPPRRAAPAKHVRPALSQHHSAPTSTGFKEHAQAAFRMHHTFNGLDAPGDTQPDSQMHKQYTSGIYSSIVEAHEMLCLPKSLFVEHEDMDDNDPPTDGLDVVNSSQEFAAQTVTSPTIVDADEHGLFAHNSLAPTSPLKFETPALAGRKRNNSGNTMSSAMRTNTTPGTVTSLSAFATGFGAFNGSGVGGGALISLTQAFNNTQAPTSPALGPINEDVAFQRPSPNFTHTRHSSPIPAYSSPIKTPRPDTPKSDPIMRSSSEPRSEYVTLKESQDRRKPGMEDTKSADVEEDDSWNSLPRHVQAKKRKQEFHQRAARSLSNISAPTTMLPTSRNKRPFNADYPSPHKSRAGRSMDTEDDAVPNPDKTMIPKPAAKEPYPEDVTPVAPRTVTKHNSNDNRIQVPKTSSHPHHTPSGQTVRHSSQLASPSSQLQRESQTCLSESQPPIRTTLLPHSSKESVAVMDSQPDVFAGFDSIPPPKSLRFPSSPSQNQYSINQTSVLQVRTGYTSQVVSSSMPPLPPNFSPENEDATENSAVITPDEDRVPSSPPVLTHDEDGENGDCIYDEYAEEVLDQEVPDSPSPDDDVDMVQIEELSVSKEGSDDEIVEATTYENSEYGDWAIMQPQKVDDDTEEKAPAPMFLVDAAGSVVETLQRGEVPLMERQDTVPETDALEETQPSFFANNAHALQADYNTNSTNQFQTAREENSDSQNRRQLPHSSRTDESDAIATGQRLQSMNDIYNLPDTQRSVIEEEIEMPQLSGFNEDDGSRSPIPPSPKRRKITYTTKQIGFHGPAKSSADTNSLSDPPSSPSSGKQQEYIGAATQQQEQEGAAAAACVRENVQALYKPMATLKSKACPRPTKTQSQKKGGLKSVSRELLQSLSSPGRSPSKSRNTPSSRRPTPVTPTKAVTDADSTQTVLEVLEVVNVDDQTDELAAPMLEPHSVEQAPEHLRQQVGPPAGEKLVPNRVFASWPGSHYYPATCIGRNAANNQLRVRFDDGNTTMLDPVHVRALDLHIGDHVKVDEPGLKKNTYLVVGFENKVQDLDAFEYPQTDRYGHATTILEEKRRESMPRAKAMEPAQQVSVPMGIIYLTTGLWGRLRDRPFRYAPPNSPVMSTSRGGTPMTEPITTPSFTRRGTAIPSLLKNATARATSVASTTRSGTGVFSNMAFVLTSTAADVDKESMTRTLKSNGGLVLEQGFHELFDYEVSDDLSSQGRRQSASSSTGPIGLVLKDAYKDLGFVALISDSHSRSTKYIQALALNVPCLHLRWVQDSLSASRAKPFLRYLLPAGVSKFLDPHGVVRSRTMQAYDPAAEETSFARTLQDRELLLRNQTVLLVTGKSKKEIERRQPFVFLTHALGAASVGRCADIAAASDLLTEGEQWDWVYVDNGDGGVADTTAELFGIEKQEHTAKSKKSKKRKRDDTEAPEELMVPVELGGHKIRVTGAEFVIQSLILGALIDE